MILTDLRSAVRTQTQTTQGDLPDPTIDLFLQQAFERTINAETQWPFYESVWDLVLEVDSASIALPGDVNQAGIMALYDVEHNIRLVQVGPEFGDDHYYGHWNGVTCPVQFSLWGGEIWLWPRVYDHTEQLDYRLRGYRRPLVWLTPGNEPDCDARLHLCLTHYATALAYAQQEDEQLEMTYMDRWQRDAEMARKQIMEPRHHRPLVFSGSVDSVPTPATTWVVEPP